MKYTLRIILIFSVFVYAGHYRYLTFLVDSSFQVLSKHEITVDSNQTATENEFRDYAVSYMRHNYRDFLADLSIEKGIFTGRMLPADPGNLAFFSIYYPPVILANMFDDGMSMGFLDYIFYGDSVGVQQGNDTLKPDEYIVNSCKWTDTISADEIGRLGTVLSDSSLLVLRNNNIKLLAIKHEFNPGIDCCSTSTRYLLIFTHTIPVQFSSVKHAVPSVYQFKINVLPNPFNLCTVIYYNLNGPLKGTLAIFSLSGQIFLSRNISGKGNVDWDASGYANGVYLCRLKAGDRILTNKLILLR